MTDDIRLHGQPAPTALINLFHGDGKYDFRIRFDELVELQEKLEEGPMRTLLKFESGDWSPRSVYEIVRLGLIGAGRTPAEAYSHAKRYVQDRPIAESAPVAAAVMSAALMGAPPASAPAEESAANG